MWGSGRSGRPLSTCQHIGHDQVANMREGFHSICDLHVFADGGQQLRNLFVSETSFVEADEHTLSDMTTPTRCLFDQARNNARGSPIIGACCRGKCTRPWHFSENRFGER